MSETLVEKVLVVDDEADWLAALSEAVTSAGFQPLLAKDGSAALDHLARGEIFLVLADLVMPEMDGIELCRRVRATHADLPFILVSARAEREHAIAGLRAGVTDVIDKPFSGETLRAVIRTHAAKRLERIALERKEAEALLAIFLDEARDQMVGIEDALLRLEQEPGNKPEVDRLFRKIHTIKGSSGSVKRGEVLTPLAHAIETVLNRLRDSSLTANGTVIDLLLSATDLLGSQLKAVETGALAPDSASVIAALNACASGNHPGEESGQRSEGRAEGRAADQEQDAGVYVPTDKLDALMEMVGELIAVKNAFYMLCREPGHIADSGRGAAKEIGQTLDKVSDRIQAQLMEVRKVTLKKVFAKLPRILRQVCAELGKDAVLDIQGEDVAVDKSVANVLSGCLSHALRNALDHGLERPEERTAAGKPAKGRVVVKAEEQADLIRLSISDDGRGIDRERVLAKAVAQGLVSEHDASKLGDDDVLQFVFASGFSTAASVTSISGRGVGMDAIQTAIWSCSGTTTLESEVGKGTSLVMAIPILKTINVERSILLESRGSLYAVPLKSVGAISTVKAGEVTRLKEHLSFQHLGRATRLATYAELSRGAPKELPKPGTADRLVVVICGKQQRFGLEIDRVIGQFDAVIRPLSRFVEGMRGFEGTAVVGNGKIAYVIAAEELVGMASTIKQ